MAQSDKSLGEWESYRSKVEAEFDGIDGVLDIEELEIVWNAFAQDLPVSAAVGLVADYAANMVIQHLEDEEHDYDESMDGDHDSAMASCGWGTDEDYGCFGGDDY